MEVTVIRSDRKTLGIEIRPDGTLLVRAPRRMPEYKIRGMLKEKEPWIRSHLAKLSEVRKKMPALPPLDDGEKQRLRDAAKVAIPPRVAYFADLMGVEYGKITLRFQKTKWGSCSSDGNLNFNCLLMLAPPDVLDSVIVHELCHRVDMSHSASFYAQVRRVLPTYDRSRAWLKENGPILLERAFPQE